MAVPVRAELFVEVASFARRTLLCWQREQDRRRNDLRGLARALPSAADVLAIPRQRLDAATAALPRALTANTQLHHRRFTRAAGQLTLNVLRAQVAQARQQTTTCGTRLAHCARVVLRHRRDRFDALALRLKSARFASAQAHRATIARNGERTQRLAERARRAVSTLLLRQRARADHAGQLLAALSYRSVLARGFALVRDETGHALRNAASVAPGMRLDLEFADGRIAAIADGDSTTLPPRREPPRAAAKPAAKRSAKPSDQGDLF
jgi:exodeoxyribonuclease VII large subunit